MSGLFVAESLGPIPGALPLSAIALQGHGRAAHCGELPHVLVGSARYFDAAGYPGRTLGLPAE